MADTSGSSSGGEHDSDRSSATSFHDLLSTHNVPEEQQHAHIVADVLDQHRVAHVRYIDGDDHVRLQLRIHGDRKSFYRPVRENWVKLRHRLQLLAANDHTAVAVPPSNSNATKSKKRRKAKKKAASSSNNNNREQANEATAASLQSLALAPPPHQQTKVLVRFLDANGCAFDAKTLAIGDVLLQTAHIQLGAATYTVLRNQPVVIKLSVLEPVLATIPIAPIPETEFCDPDDCKWQWWRLDVNGNETLCNATRRFTPSTADIGCRFRIECCAPSLLDKGASTDNDDESSKASVVTTPVVNGPQRDVFAARQSLGRTRACASTQSSAFRVMSYNILYDGYTSTDRAQQTLFAYVKPDALCEMYRMQLVFQEIMESNADVVCLQEMGEAAFASFFAPVLAPLGYATFYAGKTGSTHEGCAVFVRLDAFEVESESVMDLAAAVKESDNATVQALLQTYADLAEGFDRTPSIAQLLVLRSTRHANQRVVVANTHLFYRDDAHMIRLLQTLVLTNRVRHLQQQTDSSVVLCGDLNALPDTAAVHLLLHGHIDSNHRHWQETPAFRWKRSNNSTASGVHKNHKRVIKGQLEHDLHLASACGIPQFTNYAGGFIGTLDYVLYSEATLRVTQVFPHFSIADVSVEVALPSSVFPSDHVSLVCDLAWRE